MRATQDKKPGHGARRPAESKSLEESFEGDLGLNHRNHPGSGRAQPNGKEDNQKRHTERGSEEPEEKPRGQHNTREQTEGWEDKPGELGS